MIIFLQAYDYVKAVLNLKNDNFNSFAFQRNQYNYYPFYTLAIFTIIDRIVLLAPLAMLKLLTLYISQLKNFTSESAHLH